MRIFLIYYNKNFCEIKLILKDLRSVKNEKF
jgi:hypothetical protein